MDCERWRERIIDSLANELTQAEEALLAEHVASCAACAREARLVGALFRDAASGPEWREDPATRARLLDALRESRAGAPAAAAATAPRDIARAIGRAFSRPVPAYAAILLVALALAFGLSVRPRGGEREAPRAIAPAHTPGGEPSAESRRPLGERRFEVTGADAVLTRGAPPGDSL